MFDFTAAEVPVRPEIVDAFKREWARLAMPGTWWSGADRVAIAQAMRHARVGEPTAVELPRAALRAVDVLSSRPAQTTRAWVEEVTGDLGDERYVELLGVVSRAAAIDTFHRLIGREPAPLPEPQTGDPRRVQAEGMHKGKTWVAAGRFPTPPTVLALVPDEVEAQNDLSDLLYMTGKEMENPDWSRGDMHRTQAELVASATSFANECFY